MAIDDPAESKSFLGRGWSFPPTFSKSTNSVVMTADEEDITKSLEILLGTTIGERFLQPLYGCNLDEYVFAPFNATLSTEIRLTVKDAIDKFEPRLKLRGVKLDTGLLNEGRVDIAIEYTVINTNSRFNLIYPFYQNEANRPA
ncbi:MAG: GPW/gp25 family protein [Mucilaginibacter sp.]|nr:GPW/gp25 family protein [Mucilaginibacter sp.]